jgi:hypothetical protein
VTQLGRSISLHRGSFLSGGWAWYIGGILVLSAVVGIGKGLVGLVASDPSAGGALGAGLLAGLIGPLVLIIPVLRWQQSVEVLEGGIVWKRLYKTVTIAKDDIAKVDWIQHTSRNGTHHEIVVYKRSGGSAAIVGIGSPEQLVSFLRAWAGGAAPAAAPTGWQPPQGAQPQQQAWQPPAQQGAFAQPQQAWQPPAQQGAFAQPQQAWQPPAQQGAFAQPQQPAWQPPPQQGAFAQPEQAWPPAEPAPQAPGGPWQPPAPGGWKPPS